MAGSITLALNTAQSGLLAAQQALDSTANNIANVNTEGYSRKLVNLERRAVDGIGAGVQVSAIRRSVDENLLADLRSETSLLNSRQAKDDTYGRLQELFGTPEDNSSLAHTVSEIVTAVENLAVSPSQVLEQSEAVRAFEDVTIQLKRMTDTVQDLRLQADQDINQSVGTINQQLEKIVELNNTIIRNDAVGLDVTDLKDQRDIALEKLSQEIDIKTYTRGGGDIVVFTTTGVTLVDNTARLLSHSRAAATGSLVTKAGDGFSGINVTSGAETTDITTRTRAGRLDGLIELRDEILPNLQSQMDELAANLRDTVNTIHNRGTAYPGLTSMDGTTEFQSVTTQTITLQDGTDTRFALLDNDGNQTATKTLNQIMTSALYGSAAQPANGPWSIEEVGAKLQSWMRDEMGNSQAVVTTSDGTLDIELNSGTVNLSIRDETAQGTEGAAGGDAKLGFDRDGDGTVDETVSGFSKFFGLNDLLVDNIPDTVYETDIQNKGFKWSTDRRLYFSDDPTLSSRTGLSSPDDPAAGMGYVDIPADATLAVIAKTINESDTLTDIEAQVVPDGNGQRLRLVSESGRDFRITEALTDPADQALATGDASFLAELNLHSADVRTASSLSVRDDIISQPSLISRGTLQWDSTKEEYYLPAGANDVAQSLAETLGGVNSFKAAGGLSRLETSFEGYARSILSNNASDAKFNANQLEQQKVLTESLDTKAKSVSGVNLDEEMSNLILFEQAYNASARVISVIRGMFDALDRAVG